MALASARVELSYPPSANKLWRAVDGRNIKSAEYRRWLVGASLAIPFDQRGKVTGPHIVTIEADRPDNRARDLDNLLKPVLDSLKADKTMPALKGVIRDDSDAVAISICWAKGEPVKAPKVRVFVQAVTA